MNDADTFKLWLISRLLVDLREDPITVGEIYDMLETSVKNDDLSNLAAQIADLCAVVQYIKLILEGE